MRPPPGDRLLCRWEDEFPLTMSSIRYVLARRVERRRRRRSRSLAHVTHVCLLAADCRFSNQPLRSRIHSVCLAFLLRGGMLDCWSTASPAHSLPRLTDILPRVQIEVSCSRHSQISPITAGPVSYDRSQGGREGRNGLNDSRLASQSEHVIAIATGAPTGAARPTFELAASPCCPPSRKI